MPFGHRAQLNDPIRPIHLVIAAMIVVLGAWLRFRAAQNDLWLDEIWSLNLAATMGAWHEAFWKVLHDNNHPLNTTWLYLVGPDQAPWILRLPAIIAGTLSIVAAGWALAQAGAVRMLVAMILVAVLYPLVHFGSEARGYGLMILFALISFGAVDRARSNPDHARWLFALAVTLGTISHLSILPIAFMMTIAFALDRLRRGDGFWATLNTTLWFCAPVTGGLLLVGGGMAYGLSLLNGQNWYGGRAMACPDMGCFIGGVDNIVRVTTGGVSTNLAGLHAGLFLITLTSAVVWLMVLGHRRAMLYGTVFFGTAAVYLALGQPNVPLGRYFIPMFTFIPLILADVVGELRTRSRLARLVATLSVLSIITANAWSLTQFQKSGRGHYTKGFDFIINTTVGPSITIGSDMTFRFATVFDFLAHRTNLDKPTNHISPENVLRERPHWLVTVLRTSPAAPQTLCLESPDGAGAPLMYDLAKSIEYWGLSGMNWDIYRRAPRAAGPC